MTRAKLEDLNEGKTIYDTERHKKATITKVYATKRINGLQLEYDCESYYGKYREKLYFSRKELLTDRFIPLDCSCQYSDYCCHCKHLAETRLPDDILDGREKYKEECELCYECDFVPTESFVDKELQALREEEDE